MRRALARLAPLLLCLAACGPEATGPEPVATTPPAADAAPPVRELVADIDRRAEAIDARLGELEPVEAEWGLGATRSAVLAWLDGGELAYLEERREEGEPGVSVHRYWFDDGRLLRYRETEAEGVEEREEPQQVEIRLWFGPDGQLLASSHTVDGEPRELTEFVEPAVHAHVEELRQAVLQARYSPPAASP